MSKRIPRQRKKGRAGKAGVKSSRGRKLLILIWGLVILSISFSLMAHWRALPTTFTPPAATPQGGFNANSPSKEYVYSGGSLIATEEPAGLTSPAPSNLAATTRDGALVIDVAWTPLQGAQYYRVERSSSKDGPYTAVSTNTTQSSLSDTTMPQGFAYLYRVCVANNEGNCVSPYSNIDLATAVVFADDPLLDPQTTTGTTIQAIHITQLRAAIDAVRITAGLGVAAWDQTHPVDHNQPIYADHVIEMRARLDEARSALNTCCAVSLPSSGYTDPDLTGRGMYVIRRAHIKDLRDRVK